MGEKISDSYRARIDRYVAEYETLSFRNNFNEKFIEIITKIDNDNNTKIDAIDTYGSCNVCRQSYLNRHLHERENCELYENLFSNTMKPITLEETIDIDLWNWKAVEKTSVYFPIWNTQKEWGESLSLIEQLKDPVQIICKPERYWTLFIDKYQQDQLELMKLPKLLSQIAIIDYLPVMDEVKELKKVFDKYDQEEERGIFSKIQNNDQRTTTGHYYLFDYTITTNQYIIYETLKAATYQSYVELIKVLLNPNYYFLEQLKQLFHQCLGRLQLSEVQPSEYRSKMYLIQAVIFKLENQLEKSLQSAHDALLCHPYDAVIDGLVIYMDHSNFHSTLRQTLINDIKKRSLDLVDITPPITMMNLTFLNRTEYLRMLKKYERAILKRLAENDPIQAAYSYMDLSMTVTGSGTLLMNNLIMTCLYFFKFMNQTKCTLAELYAYRSIIFDISIEIFLLTRHYLSLYFQMYAYKLLYTLIMCSTNLFTKRLISSGSLKPTIVSQPILNDFHETILDELLKSILQLSKVTPFTHVPSTALSYDMVYMGCAGNEFLSKYLKSLAAENSMYQYYFFEGIWKGWVSAEDFDYERYCCMYLLLRDYQWTTYDVADLLRWPMIPKTHDGWYLSTKHELQLDQSGYAEVIGVTLNNDTGDIEFMFTEAKKTEHKRFDATDVMDVLTNGITYACFTLDPPNAQYHSHPFNEMRYLPKRLVKVPNYLLTLLHTDYLLKMISTGVEICSLTPFEMRSSAENLMQRLPAHIREELQSIAMKHKGPLIDSIHRFWIQLESDIEYEQVFHKNFFGRKNENIVHCYLSDKVKMCVKKHRMKYDEHGNLIDDPSDDENDQSAEAEFARIFTKYYDEIGQYFPELLRLKELLKLSVLSRIIQARYESQCNFIAQIENDTTLRDLLTEIKRKIGGYPTGLENIGNFKEPCF
ncbi:unnamed protein product [Rotaria sp. Silwood1]|nr:unnamed protein product [Rotaria sp. Silwood1]